MKRVIQRMTLYCRNCGAKLERGQLYCPNCGQPVARKQGTVFQRNRKKFLIAGIVLLLAFVLLHLPVTWFEYPVSYSGVVIQEISNQPNTYLAYLEITEQSGNATDQTAVIKTAAPADYFLIGQCKEHGTMTVTSALGKQDYPYYVQVED